MKNNKQLPINIKPFIKTFTQYLFLDTIANNHTTNSPIIGEITIPNYNEEEWEAYLQTASMKISKEKISFERNGYDIDSIKCIYREMEFNDELLIRIDHQQYSNRWDSILIFIDDTIAKFDDYSHMLYTFGRYCSGDTFTIADGDYNLYAHDEESCNPPDWLKISKKGNAISAYISHDGEKWTLIHAKEDFLSENTCKPIIGVMLSMSDNQYYKWICNNFIQIKLNINEGERINYTDFIKRDWKSYGVHPFVKISYDKRKQIKNDYSSLMQYIVSNIDSNKYVELWLDEYYVPNLESYKKHQYYHESLVYGYDKEGGTVNAISIYAGKAISHEIPIDILEQAWDNATPNNSNVNMFEYRPDIQPYDIDLLHIYDRLSDFLTGRNCSEDHTHIAAIENGVFGIKIYDEILNNTDHKEIFLQDIRMAFLLSEHKRCMNERVEYLYEWGLFPPYEYRIIKNYINEIMRDTSLVLSLVMKNMMNSKDSTRNRIWPLLKSVKEAEYKCYNLIKNILDLV